MRKKILVIDDDLAVLEMIKAALTYEKFEVKTEGRTYNILKSINEFKPDVILIDFLLDGINGGDLCHQIKSSPNWKDLPVIMISGFPRVAESLGDYGWDRFIEKPFNLSTLMDTISSCLAKHGVYYV